MKNILGLDLGTTSISFAHIVEDENKEKSEIKELGVRIVCHVLKLVYSYFVSLSDIHLFKKLSL